MTRSVLLYTEDKELGKRIENSLESIEVVEFENAENTEDQNVVILDLDTKGTAPLGKLKDNNIVITITEEKGARYLIESTTFGAFDCIVKPFENSNLKDSVQRALGILDEISHDLVMFSGDTVRTNVTCAIVGDSPMLQDVCKLVGQVGQVDVPVVITGASGTGKELVAESIWKVSTRWEKPFVVLNCAAIPETLLEAELFGYEKGAFTGAATPRIGKFEEAEGGIIFLDEIGDMPLSLQAKVLRVLQSGTFHRLGSNKEITVDIRIITATNKDLEQLVESGRFREDLYFRLNVVKIHLPALKDRREDIPLLMECFTNRHSKGMGKDIKGATREFINRLLDYDWPGNVRELENKIRKAITFAKTPYLTSYDIDIDKSAFAYNDNNPTNLPSVLRHTAKEMIQYGEQGNIYNKLVKETETILLKEALEACGGNRSKAARVLGINRLTLRRKLEEYDITVPTNGVTLNT